MRLKLVFLLPQPLNAGIMGVHIFAQLAGTLILSSVDVMWPRD